MSLKKNEDDESKVNVLNFQLAKYNLEGDFLGFEELNNQLTLCSNTYDDSVNS